MTKEKTIKERRFWKWILFILSLTVLFYVVVLDQCRTNPTATPTPTATATVTNTITPSLTSTPTITITTSPTVSPTNTATETSTATQTPTITATITPDNYSGGCNCYQPAGEYYEKYPGCAIRCSQSSEQ